MTQEEKLKEAKRLYESANADQRYVLESLFPELKESEGEKIRMELIAHIIRLIECHDKPDVERDEKYESWIAWLEKQGEQQLNGAFINADDVREEFMQEVYRILDADSTNDRANQIIDAFDNLPTVTIEKQGEQKQVAIPKFKVGDIIRLKGTVAEYTIKKVTDTTYYTNGWSCGIKRCEEDYELVEQKPAAWSEEDEYLLDETIKHLETLIRITKKQGSAYTDEIQYYQRDIDWLKSIKPQNTWKPSEEQITWLYRATDEVRKDSRMKQVLNGLLCDLKKLREE